MNSFLSLFTCSTFFLGCRGEEEIRGGGIGGGSFCSCISKSINEACSISLTFWRPCKVSSKVAFASKLIGSDSFRRFVLGVAERLSPVELWDMGYFQKSAREQGTYYCCKMFEDPHPPNRIHYDPIGPSRTHSYPYINHPSELFDCD